jgi:hemin uptake protein HemP
VTTSEASGAPAGVAPALHRQVLSGEIFRGRKEIVILHGGQEYRLRITRADKLILTK